MAYKRSYFLSNTNPNQLSTFIISCFQKELVTGKIQLLHDEVTEGFRFKNASSGLIIDVEMENVQNNKTELKLNFFYDKNSIQTIRDNLQNESRKKGFSNQITVNDIDHEMYLINAALVKNRNVIEKGFISKLLLDFKIYGYDCSGEPTKIKEFGQNAPIFFDFPITRTPFQFNHLLLNVITNENVKNDFQKMNFRITDKFGKNIPEVKSNIEFINFLFSSGSNMIQILAELSFWNLTKLQVTIADNDTEWKLWNIIRKEMKERGWYTLHPEPEQTMLFNNKTNMIDDSNNKIMNVLPDNISNEDLELFSLLREPLLSHKEIARKLGCQPHTITNRAGDLRKKYGEEVVPKRKG